ncbi:hypothetical protein H6F50_06930 [Coleofasciculus sp. FACHB-712]|uniref:hypothetical protein n=1 Tax=Coleofasciculus sp. FACHB-712 TaxID=2692789 RepID=UPI001689B56C|nr:hypothetical protein [Coleofasciculus sp. FACHB-712]MBD1942094.1 hypothetical protein [Coleofasciculus sp. FACHB-712]
MNRVVMQFYFEANNKITSRKALNMKNSKQGHFFAYFLLGIIVFSFVGYIIVDAFKSSSHFLLLLTLAGAFGGLSSSMRNQKLMLPYRESEHIINLGLIADCIAGIAGAFVIFMLLPGNIQNLQSLTSDQVLAIGIIGGYGGGALINRVVDKYLRDDVENLKAQVNETKSEIQEVKSQTERDNEASALLERFFDDSIPENPEEIEQLKKAIKEASPAMRVEAFYKAKKLRQATWKSNKQLMARTIPVFEALIESDPKEEFHRHHGHLGYALKDKTPPEWERAGKALSKAIEIRDRLNKKGFGFYEFNRAICKIETEPNFVDNRKLSPTEVREEIMRDLEKAIEDPNVTTLIQVSSEPPIREWLKVNNLSLPPNS